MIYFQSSRTVIDIISIKHKNILAQFFSLIPEMLQCDVIR